MHTGRDTNPTVTNRTAALIISGADVARLQTLVTTDLRPGVAEARAAIDVDLAGLPRVRTRRRVVTELRIGIAVIRTALSVHIALDPDLTALGHVVASVRIGITVVGAALVVGCAHITILRALIRICAAEAIRRTHVAATIAIRRATLTRALTARPGAEERTRIVGHAQSAAALVADGTGVAIGEALIKALAEASIDAEARLAAGFVATATIMSPLITAIADLTGLLAAVDQLTLTDLLTHEESTPYGLLIATALGASATFSVIATQLTVRTTTTEELTGRITRRVFTTGVRAAILGSRANLSDDATAHERASALNLPAESVIAL